MQFFEADRFGAFELNALERRPQVAVGVDVVDQDRADLPDLRRGFHERPFFEEVFGERDAPRGRVGHGVELAVAVLAFPVTLAEAGRAGGVFVVLEVLGDAVQTLKVGGGIRLVDRQAALGFGAVERGGEVFAVQFTWGVWVTRADVQDRVDLHLLVDPFLQCPQGQLKNFHALDHSRREDLPLVHPHGK
ncbi:MAG: hypothetical protein QM754_09870 [Tepidisphaeraceae bacterium]